MQSEKYKRFAIVLFWIYVVLIFIFVAVKFNGSFEALADRIRRFQDWRANGDLNYNLIPFHSILVQVDHIRKHWAWWNLLSNILVMLPYGFLLPLAYERCRRFWKTALWGFVFIMLIEIFQLVTMLGVFDVDDILLNMCGVCMGYGCFRGVVS